jgi:hypothetical protein
MLASFARAGGILSVSVETREYPVSPANAPSARPVAYENLLDGMDVYALSPAAQRLRAPHMLTPELWRRLREAGQALSGQTGEVDVFPAWSLFIERVAREFDLDPALIAAVIQTESAFFAGAVSRKGAQGLMQLMPDTGRAMGLTDPFDPEANIRAGSQYLKTQLRRFPDLEQALAAYNAGPGSVQRYGGVPPFAETRDFVARVLNHRDGFRGRMGRTMRAETPKMVETAVKTVEKTEKTTWLAK